MTERRIALAFKHHHASFLLYLDVVRRQIPRCLEHLRFDHLGNPLQLEIGLLKAKLVSWVANLVSTEDFRDAVSLQSVLAVASTLELTDHLWSHPVFVSLHLKVGVQPAHPKPVLLHFNLLEAFLKNGWTNLREELANVMETHPFVFLEKSGSVSLWLSLDEMGEVTWLRVINLSFGLDLTHSVERTKRSNHDASLIGVLLLDHAAEEVVVGWWDPVVKDWGIVHVVF